MFSNMESRKLFLHVYRANINLLLLWENSKETTDLSIATGIDFNFRKFSPK